MSMASMKVENQDITEYKPNPYGYGLCINLSEDQVEALGLKASPPAAGSSVGLRAIAQVIRVEQNADVDGDGDGDGDGVDVCLALQITDLEVTPGAMSSQSASGLLYGDN
jgi:hypothetical protein